MNKKIVKFNIFNELFIINPYNDYEVYELWWNYLDYLEAIKSSKVEIQNLLNIHPSMEIKQAKKLLYQPNNICYDLNNFE